MPESDLKHGFCLIKLAITYMLSNFGERQLIFIIFEMIWPISVGRKRGRQSVEIVSERPCGFSKVNSTTTKTLGPYSCIFKLIGVFMCVASFTPSQFFLILHLLGQRALIIWW